MKKINTLFLSLIAGICYSTTSLAMPYSTAQLQKILPQAKNVNCVTCHFQSGGTAVNQFGKDYLHVFIRAAYSKESFKKLMEMDSDSDGIINYLELLQGTNPGVARQ